VECVIKLLLLECVLGILGVPHLLIVVRRDRGWKDYHRVWFASMIVSWSLHLSILLQLLLLLVRRIYLICWRLLSIRFGTTIAVKFILHYSVSWS
jgi:hypothetical protein